MINRVTAKWNGGRQTVIVSPTFNDLPAPVLEYAQQQGYGNACTDGRITDVAYRGKVYLSQENIPSEAFTGLLGSSRDTKCLSTDLGAATDFPDQFELSTARPPWALLTGRNDLTVADLCILQAFHETVT